MIIVDGVIFYEYNLAFHFIRRNVWSPWEVIGIYLTSSSYGARCKYLPEYKRIECMFDQEVQSAERNVISGSEEFLDSWRHDYKDHDSVICPIIHYHTTRTDFVILLAHLYNRYVGTTSSIAFARLAIMLKERKRYFALRTARRRGSGSDKIKVLKKAGLI